MTDIKKDIAAKDKNLFELYESDGTHHIFIRPMNSWFDIAKCQPLHDGTLVDGTDGVLVNAVQVSPEVVAELVAKDQERKERLKRVESALKEWIEFRKSWLRKPSKRGKLRLQKKEVVQ